MPLLLKQIEVMIYQQLNTETNLISMP